MTLSVPLPWNQLPSDSECKKKAVDVAAPAPDRPTPTPHQPRPFFKAKACRQLNNLNPMTSVQGLILTKIEHVGVLFKLTA